MPVYAYRCAAGHDCEQLRPLGAPSPPEGCPTCGEPLRKRYGRVAVRYETWGFGATDSLVRDPGRKDFRALRERAERIADGSS